jgi:uncharacterized protein YceK
MKKPSKSSVLASALLTAIHKYKNTIILIALVLIVSLISNCATQIEQTSPKEDTADKQDAFSMSKQFVTEYLKAPSTADFPSYTESFVIDLGEERYIVSAYVDSENSFGAKLRTPYTCTLSYESNNMWRLDSMDISEETALEPIKVKPEADFSILNWEQRYSEYSKEFSDYVTIDYEVENTGEVDIDYYEVYFTVLCVGANYDDRDNGTTVPVGKTISDSTMVDVSGNEVIWVKIIDWELTSY